MPFGSNEAKGHRQARDLPVGNQQGKASPAKPGLMCAVAPCLGEGVLRTPLGLLTAVASEIDGTILGRWQSVQGFLAPPLHEQRDIPVGRLEQAAQTPRRDLDRGPAGEFFQRLPPRKKGVHDNEPTPHEAVATVPHAGQPTKEAGDEQGQIGDGDQSKPPRAKGGGDHASGIPAVLFYHMPLSTLICKAPWV